MPVSRLRTPTLAALGTAAVAAGGLVTAVAASAASTGCRVDYAVSSEWAGGFGANVTVTNLGDPVNGWTLTWAFGAGQQVTQAWNATVTQAGSAVTARNVDYNATVPTNGSVSFGFNGSWTSANPAPTSFTLNGTTCTGGTGPSPTPTGSTVPPSTPPPTSPPPTSPPPTSPPPTSPPPTGSGRQAEQLDRGLIGVRSGTGNLVSWRLLGTEWSGVSFNLYRGSTRVNSSPITGATNYLDSGTAAGQSYTVRAVVNGVEQSASAPSLSFASGYRDVPIQSPGSSYSANDASVGDLDGDGQYEFVLKWDPSDAKDNSQSGYTSNVYVDAYRLDGTRLWRINLGRNIRAGAHYTQFQVYDYDGDGRAEVAMKTADGTVDGTGKVIGNASADYRNSSGYVLSGPEYLTMFNGRTGAALSTVNYDPPRGTVSSWGDSYGNRVDRFLAATAYLDGQRPSLIMARGYYTRSVLAAWDFRNGALTRRWTFDSNSPSDLHRAGQPQPVGGRCRRRWPRRDHLRCDGDRRQRRSAVEQPERPRRRHARRRPGPEPARTGGVQGRRGQLQAVLVDGRRPHRPGALDHGSERGQRPGRVRRHLVRQRGRRVLVGRRRRAPQHQGNRGVQPQASARRTSFAGGTGTPPVSCWTVRTSTSTARPATPAC